MNSPATEIQNIQVGDGDVRRARDIPLHMVLPRLFTCPTTAAPNYKIGTLHHPHPHPHIYTLSHTPRAKHSPAHGAAPTVLPPRGTASAITRVKPRHN